MAERRGPNGARQVALDPGEYALILGEDGDNMSVRLAESESEADETSDLPVPGLLALALATRLLNDPEFHDEVLDWFEEHGDAALERDAPG